MTGVVIPGLGKQRKIDRSLELPSQPGKPSQEAPGLMRHCVFCGRRRTAEVQGCQGHAGPGGTLAELAFSSALHPILAAF